ncbi:MAG TPA: type II toxin-antitoxin system PemK/MazF family toxin [Pirellulaceae bacterium]
MTLGDIHWVELPDRGGREQRGHRPAIIWQDEMAFPNLPTVLVIPLTSRLDAQRFSGTDLVQPTMSNGLSVASVALVFQMGAVDIRRVGGRIGKLDQTDLDQIRDMARKLQQL